MADIGYSSVVTQDEEYRVLLDKIKFFSSIQGSISYILMSVLAVHRELVISYTGQHTFSILYLNMVFGMFIMLYTRPALQKIYKFHRFTFSLLGSIMFNQASVIYFKWLVEQLPERPWLRTLIGFFGGRLMIFYFITYLYLVDSTTESMPGGSICSVAVCKNNSKKAKESGEHLMFFTFPKDQKIKKEWISKCYRKDEFDPQYKRICSEHFSENDYEDALQAKLMGTLPRKLKKTAIPSLHLHPV